MYSACNFVIKEAPADSCFSVTFAEFSRRPFFYFDFIFDMFTLNKYMKVSFLFTFFYRKSKTKQESRVV